ncbi:hypothetical protein Nepgr_005309 [Nepenthes gracilis]|uniref:Uncharacterized protein n=1 Tax=Nepenthes gracilis TaxID=150966 RepID=A0AAD3S312_NEPGR|nr:hypothetical protein Nepgr_005309 [Nepenthes gracilis]
MSGGAPIVQQAKACWSSRFQCQSLLWKRLVPAVTTLRLLKVGRDCCWNGAGSFLRCKILLEVLVRTGNWSAAGGSPVWSSGY